jgi:hypothetical protein
MIEPERTEQESLFFTKIVENQPKLEAMLEQVNQKWAYEDRVYRFYRQSFKVYGLQQDTVAIVEMLQSLAPHLPMNASFIQIITEGTGKEFRLEDNERWLECTRPILEAFFHARYFLEMICKYGKQLKEPPTIMPSGWAAVLYLFNLR